MAKPADVLGETFRDADSEKKKAASSSKTPDMFTISTVLDMTWDARAKAVVGQMLSRT
jgi:hypothetical protein